MYNTHMHTGEGSTAQHNTHIHTHAGKQYDQAVHGGTIQWGTVGVGRCRKEVG